MTQKRIVIVEDEPDILDVLSYNLRREGFVVESSMDGAQGLALIQSLVPDLILLDLMLPTMDGLEICRQLKLDQSTHDIPTIMVTAKGEESDIVLGLDAGADDYITKPFSPKELIARVKAVLRRFKNTSQLQKTDIIKVGQLEINLIKHEVSHNTRTINFTATEFRLLKHLASNPGRVFTRDQLLDHGFERDVVVVDRNVDVHIRAIRKKIGDEHTYIETIRGVGYRFVDYSQTS